MDDGRIVHAGTMAALAADETSSTGFSGCTWPAPVTARSASPVPLHRRDLLPVLLVPVVALAALPLVGSFSTWVTLTLAGLAMGMIIFIIASGLTLVFGLMDVLNFGHGAFISIGAYLRPAVFVPALAGFLPPIRFSITSSRCWR